MILWFVDRFGLPGKYHRMWVNLLAQEGINPRNVRVISLHMFLRRQLLTKLANRKAPTWLPEETDAIVGAINHHIAALKPQAVVLASPESLACTGVHPEHATLHNLRGSVYWRHGVPHLVTLPISSWTSMVSQKEIGAANYGFENEADFTAAGQQGAIHKSAEAPRPNPVVIAADDPLARLRKGVLRHDSAESGEAGGHQQGASSAGVQAASSGSGVSLSAQDVGRELQVPRAAADGRGETGSDRSAETAGINAGVQGTAGNSRGRISWTERDTDRDSPQDTNRVLGELSVLVEARASDSVRSAGSVPDRGDVPWQGSSRVIDHEVREPSSADAADRLGGVTDAEAIHPDGSEHVPYGVQDDRDDEESGDGEAEDSTGEDDVSDFDERADNAIDVTPDSESGEDMDTFFYEPVLSPVGKFVLTADVAKLNRILKDGKNSNGPKVPYRL